ncbi:BlaI/MecI/CopY family transcriptional regulator [Paenibacillus luteus]|uniref:BlaI/MecI/CopY family transcriptional regulator n=1 Tax=Paenibacillus luteus TaxID=2545753 RepID=UPI0011435394|nr:BlaI/MecI/CopY family transcriptional regulator [Paenibacillus luteus]
MKTLPHITEAEWEVMRIIWQSSPLTASEIIKHLDETNTWKPKTVKTLISRLVQKEALGCNKDNREYTYFPIVTETECVHAESHSFLKRMYGGSLKPMLVHFLKTEKLSSEDINELKALLQEQKK